MKEIEELKTRVIEFRKTAKELNQLADKLDAITGTKSVNTRGWIQCSKCSQKHRANHPHLKQKAA